MNKSNIKVQLEIESKLVRDESITILGEFEACDDLSGLEKYPLDDSKSLPTATDH